MNVTDNSVNPKLPSMHESDGADRTKESSFVIYKGRSMNPTLMEPEIIEVFNIAFEAITKGDVIIYSCPDHVGKNVVHRVIDVRPGEVRTRGDNNIQSDSYSVTPDRIIGLVGASWSGNTRRIVHGGLRGRIISWLLMCRAYVLAISGRVLFKAYRLLSSVLSVVSRLILPDRFQPRVITYPKHARWRYQLFWGSKFIGRYDAINCKWEIRRPYRLIVDVRKLPPHSP